MLNLPTIFILFIFAAAIFLAVRSIIRDKKKGGCAGCSGGCSCGGACGGHTTHTDRCR